MKPLVSVLMTAYNREKYIAEAIESVLAQSFKDYEVIICDDASTDNTFKIAQAYQKNHSCIKLFRNSENLGQFQNRNTAASYAKGKILVYVDSDDTIRPDSLKYIADAFNNFPAADFATLYKKSSCSTPFTMNSRILIKKHFFEQSVLHIGPGGTAIRKELFEKIGGFPLLYGPAGDMYYNIKAASYTAEVILMPYDYLNYRRHVGQEINQSHAYLYQGYKYFNDILKLDQVPLNSKERHFLQKKNKRRFIVNVGKHLLKEKNPARALSAIRMANFTFKDFIEGLFH